MLKKKPDVLVDVKSLWSSTLLTLFFQVKGLADAPPPPPGQNKHNGNGGGLMGKGPKRVPSPSMGAAGPPPLKKARNPLLNQNNHNKPLMPKGNAGLCGMSQLASRLLAAQPAPQLHAWWTTCSSPPKSSGPST